MDLGTRYEPEKIEKEIYGFWEKSGFFAPENLPGERGKAFSIVLPPPNVTGTLHMGHAVMVTIQDIIIRFKRMQGFKTLWIPGTDHAAIATQEKVEKDLYKKENKTRHDLGRIEFLRRVEAFALLSHDTIVHQIKAMGASLDWTREAYTLDKKRDLAVKTAFKKMYDAGLIYKGMRIVNWDPKLQTTVSDDELEWSEEKSNFYYLKYGPFTIATARPETKFGDKYVVMHPADKRYKKYKHGERLEVEWINGKITATIIKDKAVDPKFGTGVMTITPYHDSIDFEIAERHKLNKEQIIGFDGRLLAIAGDFKGMRIKEAREKIVQKLNEKGLLVKVNEDYVHRVAKNSRGGGMIEPQIMEQWFVSVNSKFKVQSSKIKGVKSGSSATLKEIMTKAVKGGQIKIIPKRFEKIYFHWIDNLKDWCISRQIWYGHRIPVWYCVSCGPDAKSNNALLQCKKLIVSVENISKCPHCGGAVKQDPDTLDTWFSSGLWTFSTLGWPNACVQNQNYCKPLHGSDLDIYHPTSVLVTGYDILFFWVARMVLMSGFILGDIPFKSVYLHGLLRDKEGRKMSKSLGNAADPMEMIEKYGADAIRMALIIGNAPGSDLKISEDKIRGYRNFATKIWNMARFIKMHDSGADILKKPKLRSREKKILEEFESFKKEVTKKLENFKLHEAGEFVYQYLWHEFADKIIEEMKPKLKSEKDEERITALYLLRTIFLNSLKVLHPFMPFITESLYGQFKDNNLKSGMLMVEEW